MRSDQLHRRSILRLLAGGAGLTLLAACGAPSPASPAPQPTPASAPPVATAAPASTTAAAPLAPPPAPAPTSVSVAAAPTAPPAAAGQPRSGGRLRYGSLDDITSLDGHIGSSPAYDTFFNLFDRLTEYDLQQKPQPMLAESWDISSDGTQIKLNLRKGVQFHTGRELTSDDVKWNFLRVRDPKIGSGTVGLQSMWFTTIDTPDKYTVVLGSDQPRPAAFDMFEYFNIVDPVTLQGPDAKTKPVGTGPFSFVEWEQGDHFTITRNKSYWQTGIPYVDDFVMSVVKDGASMMAQLESNALDLVKTPPIQDFARLKQDPNYQALLEPEGRFFYLGANTTVPPLDNKLVRQALFYTVDRKRFVETVSLGFGTPQAIPWPSFSPAYEAAKAAMYQFDLDKARSTLNQAGVTNLTLDLYPVSLYPELEQFAQIQQSDLASLGVQINIKNIDLAAWITIVSGHQYNGLYSTAIGSAQLNPITLMSGAAYKDPGNNSAFVSPEYTQLLNQVATETDPARQKQLYSQLNDLLLDEAFVWPIATAPFRVAARASVRNIGFLLHDAVDIKRIWLA
jgi:peptide/nickel transport system substrate-binding protein